MSKILEMRQKRAELWDKAKAFLDEHQNENGVMSAEDTEEYERMEHRRGWLYCHAHHPGERRRARA